MKASLTLSAKKKRFDVYTLYFSSCVTRERKLYGKDLEESNKFIWQKERKFNYIIHCLKIKYNTPCENDWCTENVCYLL